MTFPLLERLIWVKICRSTAKEQRATQQTDNFKSRNNLLTINRRAKKIAICGFILPILHKIIVKIFYSIV
jgi:hypothetical protein